MKNIIMTTAVLAITTMVMNTSVQAGGCKSRGYSYAPTSYFVSPPVTHLRPLPPRPCEVIHCFSIGVHGKFLDRGILVTSVKHGSLACQMGLKKGDVILRINGELIRDMGDYFCGVEETRNRIKVFVKLGCSGRLKGFSQPVCHRELHTLLAGF